MGVYIKGMVMPTSCTNCERWADCSEVAWFFSSEYDYTFEDLAESELVDRRHPNCPLVEVPEPHGRLIDADAYAKTLHSLGNRDYRRTKGTIADAVKFLQKYYTPTIIERSE